jgi:hypothetical protein
VNTALSKPFLNTLLLAAWLAAPISPLWAHDGDEHEHDEPITMAAPANEPARASNQTESFEIVAVLDQASTGATLTLYLDDFATNAPVRDAKVEVESGAWQAVATMQSPGVYTAAAPALAKHGRHPLTISIDTQASTDLIDLALETGAAPADHDDAHAHAWPLAWKLAAAALMLIAAGVIAVRIRRARGSKT